MVFTRRRNKSRLNSNATDVNNIVAADEKKDDTEKIDLNMNEIGFKCMWKENDGFEHGNQRAALDASSLNADNLFVESVNGQDWLDLGKSCQPSYSTDVNEMKGILCSLLNYRLEKLVSSRKTNACSNDNANVDSGLNNNTSSTISNLREMAEYVERICDLYIMNDYHNFHHAYHVTLSTNKLIEMMIVNSSILHDDHLAQFALVFSALIHDVAHKGIPNFILIKLEDELAAMYNKTSIAEKNSLTVAFEILNEDNFSSLRNKIYGSNPADAAKFKNIAEDTILCTDIFNAGRMAIAKERWEQAFSPSLDEECEQSFTHNAVETSDYDINEIEIDKICIFPDDNDLECQKKTSALEHLIQVADVAHNFQSWEVFIKWNYRLVKELMVCHESGWMGDVTATWNDGQQNFTDTYVLPLFSRVHKMKIFSDYDYNKMSGAVENISHKWKVNGKEICSTMQHGVKTGEKEEVVIGKILTNNKRALSA